MLGRGHQPRAGVARHTAGGPLLERGDQRIVRKIFGDRDVTHDAREAGDDLRRFHPPDGVDGVRDVGARQTLNPISHAGAVQGSVFTVQFSVQRSEFANLELRTLN